ncbi:MULTISPECIES: hypothetical protein [Leptospira]|uniref:hypothetical protein n=1 Tax=Leptospira TaxID=171 RepID=UPI000A64F12A|nr:MULTISPECIES: hypothetical protein [Leptospira]
MKTNSPRTIKEDKEKKHVVLSSKALQTAIKDAFKNERLVLLSQKEYKTILKELEDIRRSIKEIQEDKEPTKEEILADLAESINQVNLDKQGKIKLRSAYELIDEL